MATKFDLSGVADISSVEERHRLRLHGTSDYYGQDSLHDIYNSTCIEELNVIFWAILHFVRFLPQLYNFTQAALIWPTIKQPTWKDELTSGQHV